MTDEVVRREVRHSQGDRHPHEIGWTHRGTWVIPDMHLGRWTARMRSDEDTPEFEQVTGGRCTRDELHMSIISIARQRGWTLAPETASFVEHCDRLLDVNSPQTGTAHLPDRALADRYGAVADEAVAWLNQSMAPAGRRFVIEDALYLISMGE